MKVLLYSQKQSMLKRSGIGRAFYHQKKALESVGIEYTTDPKDTYDLVHVNIAHSKVIRQFRKKYPVIVHGHSTVQDFRRSFAMWRFIAPFFYKHLQNIYRDADLIITPTRYSKFLIESMHVVKAPVLAISNGIHLPDYAHDEKKIQAFRERFNLKPDQKVVIGVGLLFERKGIHDFIEVARTLPDVTFIWFGGLPGYMMTHFIRKAIKRKPKNVIMAGYVEGDVMKGAFQGATCMFFPSYEETEGIVVLEALASRLPIIIRDIPVYYDWLFDKKHVFKGHNNYEFKMMIESLCKNDVQSVVDEGYKIVEERSIEKVGIELKAAYEKVLEMKKNTR
ncbi:glycosyltransferase family 4 protein [Acholeplasma equirhinis]|uniref:processive diacylglycerol alpha-glucosyltransferase n=1 Tax=Acholeplasma equirhinis TaxID=555393 RepID=UPI00197AFE3D|nr:glycosyltransferase family 4 protein [Acholeplasma equirhinis]MBN3490278.1 glycosyltransferase family 4 protein [Acholeplasma equirhinis]